MSQGSPSVAVIGAGVCGASAARVLADAGLRVVVHDKGRAPGGRASTRAGAGDHHDHGAQYFTARDAAFVDQLRRWSAAKVAAEWQPRLVAIAADGRRSQPAPERRWVGMPGMGQLAASLLAGTDLRCGSRVVAVERHQRRWWLRLADGSADGPHDALLCTLPAPQARELLAGDALMAAAAGVQFAPCWALLVEFAEAFDAGFDAAFVNGAGPLSWLARDSSKPGRPAGERWVAHAGPEYSRANLDSAAPAVAAELTAALRATLASAPPLISRASVHRWRYALAQPPLHIGALADGGRCLAVGGDWCHGSRVEGAWCSGRMLAAHAIGWLGGG